MENILNDIHKLLVATDSKYVRDGRQGSIYRWKAAHWCTTKGPLANVDLWAALLAAQEAYHAQVSWCQIPSHVSIPGNEEADALAERGWLMSSLYHSETHQDVPPASMSIRQLNHPPWSVIHPAAQPLESGLEGCRR